MHHDVVPFSPPAARRHWLLAISGLAEVAVLIGLSIAAGIAVQRAFFPDFAAALGLTGGTADFIRASAAMATQFAAQYGALFSLAALIGWLRGRRSFASYAIRAPSEGVTKSLANGLALGLVISIGPASILVLQDIAPIGQDAPLWAVARQAEWDWRFWLFMAVSSFALVPLLEEGAWRGYVLGRLTEGFSPGPAVLVTTLLFAGLHVQYLRADAAMLSAVISLLVGSVALGYATLRSGSLPTAIVAHAVLNFPLPTEANVIKIIVAVIVLIALRRKASRELALFAALVWRLESLLAIAAAAVLAGAAILALSIPNGLFWLFTALLGLLLTSFFKRSAWAGE